eukprot:SAG31_NODE_796_length_12032_cov_21.073242_10_plen_167_part_00
MRKGPPLSLLAESDAYIDAATLNCLTTSLDYKPSRANAHYGYGKHRRQAYDGDKDEFCAATKVKIPVSDRKFENRRLAEVLFHERWQQYRPTLYWLMKDLFASKQSVESVRKCWPDLSLKNNYLNARTVPLVNGSAIAPSAKIKASNFERVVIICVLGGWCHAIVL